MKMKMVGATYQKKQDAEDTRISRVAGKNENGWS